MLLLGVVQAQAAGDEFVSSYDLLATEILTGSQASVTFSSLGDYAADYQHLQIRASYKSVTSDIFTLIRFNGDTAANYSWHLLRGTGSAVQAFAGSGANYMQAADLDTDSQNWTAAVYDILDPFETTKYTTLRGVGGQPGDPQIQMNSGSWRNTAALTSITVAGDPRGLVAADSRFSLYGIKAV
jgi:hypothetical protein